MQHRTLSQFVAASLVARAPFLARHWQDRARAATPRHPSLGDHGRGDQGRAEPGDGDRGVAAGQDGDLRPVSGAVPDPGHAERVLRALADEVVASTAAAALIAGDYAAVSAAARDRAGSNGGANDGVSNVAADIMDPVARDARLSAEVMQLGWEAGGRAFASGLSVHHVVRDADLLLAIVLTDLERELEVLPSDVVATPAAAFGAARRLQRSMGRYTQAAASGFVHALLRSLRERYRLLRHDLRNPLGTIRSALSLMDDESVPEEMRHGPGIRSMVARNAGSLDRLIASGLDDAAAAALLLPPQDVALRDVAVAARREVREAARLAECDVILGDIPTEPPSYVDPEALEITLTALLLAALANASPGDAVRIDCTDRGDAKGRVGSECADGRPCAVMRLTLERPVEATGDASNAALGARAPRWDPFGLELAASLAIDHGGSVGSNAAGPPLETVAATLAGEETLYLRLPASDPDTGSADGAPPALPPSAG